jgi:aminodeoxyfutalosine deaminase
MRYFSAQYIFTSTGLPVKRGIITANDDGTIVNVEDTGGHLHEKHSVEFHNGIIVPGFINCHCHLELSYLRNEIKMRTGLGPFLMNVNTIRHNPGYEIEKSIRDADSEMYREGIVLCADICNSSSTFALKTDSRIKYISLLEVFGIDPEKAGRRFSEIKELSRLADEYNILWEMVPHALYSISIPLLRLIKNSTRSNRISSLHFLESPDEITFLRDHAGPIMESYSKFLSPATELSTVENHVAAVLGELNNTGNLVLVHNTFIKREQVRLLKKRDNLYYCLCPNSNLFIEGRVPPADMLYEEGCKIVIGTDSLSSNNKLSIFGEIMTISREFPDIPLEDLVRWATINGAEALCENIYGSIEPGKRPGLLLIKDADLVNLKLKPGSTVQRLI